jgi:putative membrane protein
MPIIIRLLVNGIAVFVASYVTPGVEVESFVISIIVAIILGVLNAFLKPILVLLTLPVNILTLGLFILVINTIGLFILVINTIIVLLASAIVPGFMVSGFVAALIFSLVLSLVSWFLSLLT